MDFIHIVDLEVYGHHGVFPEENTLGQKFVISAHLHVDTRTAGKTDDLEQSVDYGSVCHVIHDVVSKETYKLIESVAERIAEEVLNQFSLVQQIRVEVKKPWAPIGLPVAYASVEIERTRTQ